MLHIIPKWSVRWRYQFEQEYQKMSVHQEFIQNVYLWFNSINHGTKLIVELQIIIEE